MSNFYESTVLKQAISPQSTSADTPIISTPIDTRGFDAVQFGVLIGSVGDADVTFAVSLAEANSIDAGALVSGTAVPAGNILGASGAAFQFDDDNEVRKVEVKPTKRYVTITITPTGNSGTPSAALLAAFAQLLGAKYAPATQPAA